MREPIFPGTLPADAFAPPAPDADEAAIDFTPVLTTPATFATLRPLRP